VAAARRIYTPATNPRTHEQIFPPMERGSELVRARLAGGPQPIQLADDHFKYIVFENPAWDFRTLNFDTDLTRAMAKDNGVLSATGPDLAPFSNRGGKLIHFHGWTDQQVMPENSIHYFERVRAKLGSAADSSYAWDPPVNWDICAVAGRNPNARRDSNAGLNKRKNRYRVSTSTSESKEGYSIAKPIHES
jgi:hypothetical protein